MARRGPVNARMAGLRVLHVEVSSRCPLACPGCPREEYRDYWREADMPLSLVDKLVPFSIGADFVLFMGWGEPLAHPELPEIVSRFAAVRVPTAVTTAGTLLTRELGRELIRAGLSGISVTIAGARPATHGRLRPGSELEDVLERLALFRERAGGRVRTKLVFLQQRENIRELPRAVVLARRLKVDDMAAVNRAYLPRPELSRTHFLRGRAAGLASLLANTASFFFRQKFTQADYTPDRHCRVCLPRPHESMFVGVGGEIAPCMQLLLPLQSPDALPGAARLVFGRAQDGPGAAWADAGYAAFREVFARRETGGAAAAKRLLEGLEDLDPLGAFRRDMAANDAESPLPRVCSLCPKRYGL